jgi:hypothetical protein
MATEKLKTAPEDREANLVVGRHVCLNLGDWDRGLKLLSKGSDAKLRAMADDDRFVEANDANAQMKLGDNWFEYAKPLNGRQKFNVLARAKHWYEKALPGLDKLNALNVGSRVRSLEKTLADAGPAAAPAEGQPKTEARKPGAPIVRKNFNTIKTEETVKSQWTFEGNYRIEALGLRLQKSPAMSSKFQLLDGGKIVFRLTTERRDVTVRLCEEDVTVTVPYGRPAQLAIERKGRNLNYELLAQNRVPERNTILMAEDKAAAASVVTFNSKESNVVGRSEDVLFHSIVVTGPVKPTE